jgi:hypothetical protein
MRERIELPASFMYEHTDIPPGMTLAEYRTLRSAQRCRRRSLRPTRALAWARTWGRRLRRRRRVALPRAWRARPWRERFGARGFGPSAG